MGTSQFLQTLKAFFIIGVWGNILGKNIFYISRTRMQDFVD